MLIWIVSVLVATMLIAAVLVLLLDNMVAAVATSSVVGLALSALFVVLHAPDVAMTEAAVGAGLSGVILALALRRLGLWHLDDGTPATAPGLPVRPVSEQEGNRNA